MNVKKSTMEWLGEKVLGQHTGNILLKSGEFTMMNNIITSGTFEIDMNSITNTDLKDEKSNKKIVGHLKSGDFFNASEFPVSKFVIKSSTSFISGSGKVKGDLTIKGITLPVEFKAVIDKTKKGIKIFGNVFIDRSGYNVKFGSGSFFKNLGDKTIYDAFKVKLNIEAIKK